ncbi:hypothetical protein KKG31_07685 [Patescibacteria group bacterium]|nr:hypothetical protein [Patescibacteria group bacterium]MBU1758946.1 hypothetical protein [Patescibacteria group bacterium]
MQEELESSDFVELSRQIAHLFAVFDSVMYINKRMYGASDFYFTYSESAKFTSWDEFVELFNHTHITFFSNTNKQYKKLAEVDEKSEVSLTFYEEKYTELIDHLSDSLKQESPQKRVFFVVSTQKEQSKKIFEELYEKGIHKEASLLVENIT